MFVFQGGLAVKREPKLSKFDTDEPGRVPLARKIIKLRLTMAAYRFSTAVTSA